MRSQNVEDQMERSSGFQSQLRARSDLRGLGGERALAGSIPAWAPTEIRGCMPAEVVQVRLEGEAVMPGTVGS